MADNSNQLLLDALTRAVAEPAGIPLLGHKKSSALFAGSAAKKLAQQSKEEGFVRTLRTETKGRTTREICAITDKGLAFLLDQSNPKQVLESLVHALEAGRVQVGELVESARRTQAGFESLRSTAEKVLQQLQHRPAPTPPCDKAASNGNGTDASQNAIRGQLTRWHTSGALEDCPLPLLYRNVCESSLTLTVGQFHDALRRLQECMQAYLHPWTGPLYEIPEPAFALMVGHEIAYYASLRQ
jgi:hypothetical protein